MTHETNIVIAQAVLRSRTDQPLCTSPQPNPVAERPAYIPIPGALTAARQELRQLGFDILGDLGPLVSVAASAAHFEEIFGVAISRSPYGADPDQRIEYYSVEGDRDGVLHPPAYLDDLLEGVVVDRPAQLAAPPALPPIVPPEMMSYPYLVTPDHISWLLGCTPLHTAGHLGTGVRIAIPDTGFADHPFFSRRGYHIEPLVRLVGADLDADNNGHGTAMVASALATAPGAHIVPLKMPSHAYRYSFTAAVQTGARVISCSWGTNIDHPPGTWTMETNLVGGLIDAAIEQGAIVCCAAGNGAARYFPASYPEVIAVGGVHVDPRGPSYEASDFAGSFESALYPGRFVPDICGLVGHQVGQGAPLLLLPVPLGSSWDNQGLTGWSLMSGTSSACAQVAGVAAITLQQDPTRSNADIKRLLMDRALGIADPAGNGSFPGGRRTRATGAGLVQGV